MADDIESIIAKNRLVGEAVRAELTGVSRTSWRALEARGRETGQKIVPDRVAISPGKSGWKFIELLEWVKARPAYTPPAAPTCTRRAGNSESGGA